MMNNAKSVPIVLGVKCAQSKDQFERAISLTKKYSLRSIEIQEVFNIMEKIPTEKRADIVANYLRNAGITHIAYHYPIKSRWDSVEEAKSYDLAWKSNKIIEFSRETIKEAVLVASKLKINNIVPVNFHLFRFVDKKNISEKEKEEGLKTGEKVLLELKDYADTLCKEYGLIKDNKPLIQITRENNPPDHGTVDGLLDYHPLEIVRTKDKGIKNCLDFAHLEQYMNYLKEGKGELPGADIDKKYYAEKVNWDFAINALKENIILVHVNDAYGYKKEGEGLEMGAGNIDYRRIFELLREISNENVIYTIEIKDGHINWNKVENSIIKIIESQST